MDSISLLSTYEKITYFREKSDDFEQEVQIGIDPDSKSSGRSDS